MFDSTLRLFIDPPLNHIGKRLAALGMTANTITLIGFLMGLIAIALISIQHYHLAILFFCFNRLLDGIDGAVGRQCELSDFGGLLDIVCDFIIYGGMVFAFGIANLHTLFYAAFLLFSFIGPISSFLAYATIAAKNKISSTHRGIKSFYYIGGICEGTETSAALILACLIPTYFNEIALIYGILCWLTTVGRVYIAWRDFGLSRPTLEYSSE